MSEIWCLCSRGGRFRSAATASCFRQRIFENSKLWLRVIRLPPHPERSSWTEPKTSVEKKKKQQWIRFIHHLKTETLGLPIYQQRIRRVHCTLFPFKQCDESTAGSDQPCFFISTFILVLPVLLFRLILLHIIVLIDKCIPSVWAYLSFSLCLI